MQLGKTGVGWLGAQFRSLGAGPGGIDAWAIPWIDNARLPCMADEGPISLQDRVEPQVQRLVDSA